MRPKFTKEALLLEMETARTRLAEMECCEAERKQLEQELRKSENILEKVFDTTQVLLAYMDANFTFIRVNRAYADAGGHPPEFFIGKNHFDLYPQEENQTIFRRVVETGQPFSVYAKPFEYAEYPERGVTYWDWSLLPVQDDSGKVEAVLLCLVDVTRRVRSEEELRQYRGRLEEIIQEQTGRLAEANEQLRGEITERRRVELSLAEAYGASQEALTELQTAEEELREQNEELQSARTRTESERRRYQELFEFAPDAYLVTDVRGVIREANHSAAALFNVPGDELLRKPLVSFVARNDMKDFLGKLSSLENSDKPQTWETRIQPSRCKPLDAEIIAAHAAGDQAHESAFRWMIRDVTLRKESERVLREAHERLTTVLDSVSDGFFSIDDQFTVTFFNAAAEQLLNRRAKDVLGRHLFEAFPEAKGSIFEEKYTYALRNKVALTFETYFVNPRYENWYEVRVYPYRDGISIFFQVTTARKLAEEALRRSEEQMRLLTDAVPVLISYVDSSCRYQFNNKGYEDWFGRSRDEIRGKHLREILGDSAYQRIRPHVEKALSGQNVFFEDVITYEGGGKRYIQGNYVPHIDEHGDVQGFYALIADISERKRSEEALRESEAQLRELSENLEEKVRQKTAELLQAESMAAVGRMVSTVAHEIRNPLQTIEMGVDALRNGPRDQEHTPDILEEINYGANLLKKTVSDLLNYSKPVQLDYTQAAMSDIVRQVLQLLHRKIEHITVVVDVEAGEEQLFLDSPKIQQVLVNVISNAADAMPEGGTLGIHSRPFDSGGDNHFQRIIISDTGEGIAEENLKEIFEPFFTTKAKGTGLGLPLCKKIVLAHGGSMNVRSKLGEGTSVEITLPTRPRGRPDF
jgi:PAS domain S-box-containing protein